MEIRSIWLNSMKQPFSCLKADTIKAIALVCLAVGIVGMSYGSLAMAYGFPVWVPFALSLSVLAGASEFMFIGIIASGGNPLAAAAAGCWSTPAIFRSASRCASWSANAASACWVAIL
jgi:hypothetical protein